MHPTPRVNILAYSGGLMHVPVWGHLVIDLSGLDLSSSQIGILSDHDATLKGIVGHGQAEVRNGKLLVTGTIAEATDAARQIITLAKSGFQFQASVGVSPTATERVESHQKVEVNGRLIKSDNNGFLLVRSGLLREVSIVAIGADPGTAVSISASLKKENESMADDSATLTAQEIRTQAARKVEEPKLRQFKFNKKTSNDYLVAFKSFCNWLLKDGRSPSNPVAHLV